MDMCRAIETRWASGLILVGLAVGMLGSFANAQEPQPQRQPGDYFWLEVTSGTVGALAGGIVTAYAGALIVGYLYPCVNQTAFWGCLIGAVLIAEVAFLIGASVGSAIGVVMAGSFKRVQGNILLAFTGAIAGETVGLFILGGATRLFPSLFGGNPVFIFSSLVLSPALGATLGYNVNARVEPIVLSPTSQGFVLVGLKTRLNI